LSQLASCDETEFTRLDRLATRAIQSIAECQRYLRYPEARRDAERFRPKGPGDRARSHDPNEQNVPNVTNDSNDSNV
jgi:hypothetical protein